MIDSGATCNVLNISDYQLISDTVVLEPTSEDLFTYGKRQRVDVLGTVKTKIDMGNRFENMEFVVVNTKDSSILGYSSASLLGFIQINPYNDTVFFVNKNVVEHTSTPAYKSKIDDLALLNCPESVKAIIRDNANVFTGMGKYNVKQIKLHVDPTVKPICQSHRRVPYHLRKKVETELKSLEESDILEKVEGPTPWVSPIVIVPKPGTDCVRICGDYKAPNLAIQRERHATPTVQEILTKLHGSTIFSKLDANKHSLQFELYKESRNIATISTHVGLRRYKRLPFGINSAAEICQNEMSLALQNIPGIETISDDIIIHGNDQNSHDKALRSCLSRLLACGLTLGLSK
uniref:Uncharacterized protein K02A2.6-like n=1 Tax=Saccoglossus kowalevskii TaxID=10224 RepID=A0ABM0GLD2_SACKO|nr:PREDICTED: uncharacterized protein K02A2.6-like [Saccoglossus kowalevskii]